MSVSTFDHQIMSSLLGDEEVSTCFSVEAECKAMLRYEVALAKAQAVAGLIPEGAAREIEGAFVNWQPDLRGLRKGFATDGVVVPELVRQMRNCLGTEHAKCLHYGSTSQDVIDTALVLRLKTATGIIVDRLNDICNQLEALRDQFGEREVMGITRMQDALPLDLHHRIEAWLDPLARCLVRLEEMDARLFCVQLGGAVGDNAKLSTEAEGIARQLAEDLGLHAPSRHWQNTRDNLGEYASWLSLVCGSLGKMGQDVVLMAQSGTGSIRLAGGGGSSAMPHKQNPVLAESLVTLARFNATQLSAIHHALVHEMERSGSAWALEWMVLPQMVVATGAATRNANRMLASIADIAPQV